MEWETLLFLMSDHDWTSPAKQSRETWRPAEESDPLFFSLICKTRIFTRRLVYKLVQHAGMHKKWPLTHENILIAAMLIIINKMQVKPRNYDKIEIGLDLNLTKMAHHSVYGGSKVLLRTPTGTAAGAAARVALLDAAGAIRRQPLLGRLLATFCRAQQLHLFAWDFLLAAMFMSTACKLTQLGTSVDFLFSTSSTDLKVSLR